jgi:hypothetical protein
MAALGCTPNDLLDVDTTPVQQPAGGHCRRCEPLPALRPVRCAGLRDRDLCHACYRRKVRSPPAPAPSWLRLQ